jgi:ribulose-5-phosphate 4-epimerase/fuculose-1-phosphate aldolase
MLHRDFLSLCNALKGFVVGAEGNVSIRTSQGFIIKCSGTRLKDARYIHCDIDGVPLIGEEGKPSMEVSFHSWIYKNSGRKVIAHTHPVNLLKVLCTEASLLFCVQRLFPDQVLFNESSCLVAYATPGRELTEMMGHAVRMRGPDESFPKLFLLESHGIICCANSVDEAITMTEICEKAAEVFIGTQMLGGANPLTQEQVEDILGHEDEAYRRSI